MAKFVALTQGDGVPVYVNADHVMYVRPDVHGVTELLMCDPRQPVRVKESPKDVAEILGDGGVYEVQPAFVPETGGETAQETVSDPVNPQPELVEETAQATPKKKGKAAGV